MGEVMNMVYLKGKGTQFAHHSQALHAIEVMFQQASRLCSSLMETRSYYSAKYKIHSYDTKASVLPNGIWINQFPRTKGDEA